MSRQDIEALLAEPDDDGDDIGSANINVNQFLDESDEDLVRKSRPPTFVRCLALRTLPPSRRHSFDPLCLCIILSLSHSCLLYPAR